MNKSKIYTIMISVALLFAAAHFASRTHNSKPPDLGHLVLRLKNINATLSVGYSKNIDKRINGTNHQRLSSLGYEISYHYPRLPIEGLGDVIIFQIQTPSSSRQIFILQRGDYSVIQDTREYVLKYSHTPH